MDNMKRSSTWATAFVLMSCMNLLLPSQFAMAADPDPLQDFCVADLGSSSGLTVNGYPCKPAAKVSARDFLSTALSKPGDTATDPATATVTPAFVTNFPALNTLGLSAARIDIAPGGVNPPHTHPRAAELILLAEGSLYVGFVSSNGANNTLFATILQAGELFVIPRGLVHFQMNVGKGNAVVFAAFGSQSPGLQVIAPALFAGDVSDEVLQKGFRVSQQTVDMIQKQFHV